MRVKTICWLSSGVSSFISAWCLRNEIDEYYYIDVKDQHPDSIRFIRDCEHALGKKVHIVRSSQYRDVESVIRAFGFIRNVHRSMFYPCTNVLKKRVRKEMEEKWSGDTIRYIWGFDVDEQERAVRLVEAMPQFDNVFPLIDELIDKTTAHALCKELDIKRPLMYDMGYHNNNCVGCVKGGCGYWNKIRNDFPKVFESRAKMERDIGYAILKDKGIPLYLDELPVDKGRKELPIVEDCGIFCELTLNDWGKEN